MDMILPPAELLDPVSGEWTPLRDYKSERPRPKFLGHVVEIVETLGLPKVPATEPTVLRPVTHRPWLADGYSAPTPRPQT